MKKLKYILPVAVIAIANVFISCVTEDDQELPNMNPVVYIEDFQGITTGSFNQEAWTIQEEEGTKKWFATSYRDNGYFEFSPFNSGQEVNIGWLVTPSINIDEANAKKFSFKIAQHHVVDNTNNYVKVYVSTDFAGDVTTATWVEKEIKLPPVGGAYNYDFYNSGTIDISEFSGNIYIGFKAVGGTATANAGAYQIDDIKVF